MPIIRRAKFSHSFCVPRRAIFVSNLPLYESTKNYNNCSWLCVCESALLTKGIPRIHSPFTNSGNIFFGAPVIYCVQPPEIAYIDFWRLFCFLLPPRWCEYDGYPAKCSECMSSVQKRFLAFQGVQIFRLRIICKILRSSVGIFWSFNRA